MHWFTLVLRNQHLTQELSATTVPSQTCRIISKLAEHVVARRLTSHVVEFNLLPTRQSAYRPYHSTETAVLSVHNDLVYAIDNKRVSLLVLLDLSAAFDTVDNDILLSILANRFSIQGLALDWFRSYLANRTQTFTLAGKQTASYPLDCSVLQGSVLGPLGFISYTEEDIVDVIERHSVLPHIYADDTQLLASAKPENSSRLRQ